MTANFESHARAIPIDHLDFTPRPHTIRLLTDLVNLLESDVVPYRAFDMSVWYYKRSAGERPVNRVVMPECGTVACAFGWGATMLPSWQDAGIKLVFEHSSFTETLRAKPYNSHKLGLTSAEDSLLFTPWVWATRRLPMLPNTRKDNYPREKVVRLIRWVIAREKARQADYHVQQLNQLAQTAAWNMSRSELRERARTRHQRKLAVNVVAN